MQRVKACACCARRACEGAEEPWQSARMNLFLDQGRYTHACRVVRPRPGKTSISENSDISPCCRIRRKTSIHFSLLLGIERHASGALRHWNRSLTSRAIASSSGRASSMKSAPRMIRGREEHRALKSSPHSIPIQLTPTLCLSHHPDAPWQRRPSPRPSWRITRLWRTPAPCSLRSVGNGRAPAW